jgi:NADPH:quinone reductase-like Zn-dependent oxidoreductase
MKAAQINEYGDVSVIHMTDADRPTVAKEQALVEVHASSLNPADSGIRAGFLRGTSQPQFPMTLGGDIAGVVMEVSEGVTDASVGDRVYGQASVLNGDSGALAEYAAAAVERIAKMPEGLDFIQAASLPLVGVSALQALQERIKLLQGQKIFIHGGAGGIGAIAIQIAKHVEAYVAATATGDGLARVKELGADEIIDYKAQDFVKILHDFDAVFDTVGDDFAKALGILRPGGTAVSMTAQADEAAARLGVTASTLYTQVTSSDLDELRRLVEMGAVVPHVASVFTLEQIKDAFEAREGGAALGKIVIEIQ